MLQILRTREAFAPGLMATGLGVIWLGDRLARDWAIQAGLFLLGFGIGTPARLDLRALPPAEQNTPALRRLWGIGQIVFRLAVGWTLAFVAAAALLLGWEGVGRGLLAHPGLLLIAGGLVLLGVGIGRLLALDEVPAKGRDAALRFPVRLAGLPAILIGIGLTAVGAFQTLAPQGFHDWVQSIVAGRALGN
jgi:hypothetical protein